ncbi:tetratricopeptide repeat protein [Mongoliitalea daihaiensis]|uniref:tetratricopeptide repeat protein n=1 Tax=Mongoliitalea daihaiensis TaxID=2782006 RepID=UPI001F48E70C|nr:tetratricopeptide repeat protein [Mongoliitalea daihaiensis]UJP66378.1 tetratricopeptide repeat protein [Mongoliitalea daihaiensis]
MKAKIVLAGLLFWVAGGLVQAQDGWNWPSDPAKEAKARELNAAYVDYMKSEQFVEATKGLNWLLINVPDLNESIYINGTAVYDGASKASTDEAQKRIYQDSVMTIYDLRKDKYDNESVWIENKAYFAYQYFLRDKDRVGDVVKVFDRALEVNGGTLKTPGLAGAFFNSVYFHNAYNKAFTKVELLARYEALNKILDEAEANGTDVSAPRGNLEQLVVVMELIDCDFIENTLGPKLIANPTDMALAQQVFKYSFQYKCLNNNSFMVALEIIDNESPTFATSQVRAMKLMQARDYEKAIPVLEKALNLAEKPDQKAEILFDLAKAKGQQGNKSAARSYAIEAAKADDTKAKEAYNLVAQLIMGSFNDCRRNVSRAEDQAIFIAAYNYYQRAGNSEGMRDAKARFPSKEELFTEGKQAGQTVTVGCWIGETVTLATRD